MYIVCMSTNVYNDTYVALQYSVSIQCNSYIIHKINEQSSVQSYEQTSQPSNRVGKLLR